MVTSERRCIVSDQSRRQHQLPGEESRGWAVLAGIALVMLMAMVLVVTQQ